MIFARSSSRPPVRVQPFFGYRNAEKLVLTARALRQAKPVFEPSGFWRSLGAMMGQYASREVAGLDVALEFVSPAGETLRKTAATCEEGFAHFEISFGQPCDLPLRTSWETATLSWRASADGPKISNPAYILAPGQNAGIGVISDIDDTILETGITGNARSVLRNWRRVFAQMPGERITPHGAPEFFAALGGRAGSGPQANSPRQSQRPVFYVSSSPWNLFSYLVNFKHQRNLPLGPIMLRDWGFNRETLGSEGHGSHKRAAIGRLLSAYPDMQFVLVGDDTQKDLTVFGETAIALPERIAAVFIRQIAGRELSEGEQAITAQLIKSTVPFWMGSDYVAARRFIGEAGIRLEEATDD